MTTILLSTFINAPAEIVYNFSRNIDVHLETMDFSNEKAIAGKTSGYINLGETVTWQGTHLGFKVKHQSIITEMNAPHYFVDEMQKGLFKTLKHEHIFNEIDGKTIMIDKFHYTTFFNVVGEIIDICILKRYLTKILTKRSINIKQLAEHEFSNS